MSEVETGDEMNIHAIQSYEAETELRMLMLTSLNIITAQESKPIITITQDSLVASYLMTRRDFKLSRTQFSDICMKAHLVDGSNIYNPERIRVIEKILRQNGKKPEVFNGRGLISLLLPPNLNYENKNDVHPDEPKVIIKQGVYIAGALNKAVLGSTHNSLLTVLNKEYGTVITANFIDNIQFIANAWLLVHGFSVGLEDCMIANRETIYLIKDTLAECYTKAQGIEQTTRNAGVKEVRVTAALSQATDSGMKIAKEGMSADNDFLVTVISGAKGDFFNIAQITGLLGQQNLDGKRINYTMNNGKRSLPHYPFEIKDKEEEYESRGFIRHSFIHGLNPKEFFFHCMSGRQGAISTALATAKTGYTQRRIVKVCEDIKVQFDGSVRDASNNIYQFSYGGDGYDPTKTVRVDKKIRSVDIGRLADRLNTNFENDIKDEYNYDILDVDVNYRIEDKSEVKFVEEVIEEEDEEDEGDEGDEGDEEEKETVEEVAEEPLEEMVEDLNEDDLDVEEVEEEGDEDEEEIDYD